MLCRFSAWKANCWIDFIDMLESEFGSILKLKGI